MLSSCSFLEILKILKIILEVQDNASSFLYKGNLRYSGWSSVMFFVYFLV